MVGSESYFRKTGNVQSVVRHPYTTKSFYEFVESVSGSCVGDYIAERTAVSFTTCTPVATDSTFDADERNIRNWVARLIAAGAKDGTVRRYLGKLHVLYQQYAGQTPEGEALFLALRDTMRRQSLHTVFPEAAALPCIKAMSYRLSAMTDSEVLSARVLFYLLCSAQFSLTAAVDATFADTMPDVEQIVSIVDSLADPRRKYLFPLGQGKQRMPQIVGTLSSSLITLLHKVGCASVRGVTADTLRGWWIETALSCGIKLETIRSVVQTVPQSHPWLGLIQPVAIYDASRLDALRAVATCLNPTSPRWYVLCLRHRVTPDDIRSYLANEHPALSKAVKLFYPTHAVIRLVGKKRVREHVPYIPHILFVKTAPDKVLPLVNAVGHLAWCYKTANRPDAPYSVIPWSAMKAFQRFIGVFDDDARLECVKNTDLTKGRRVRVTGGPYAGCEGEIIDQEHTAADTEMRTFVLRIANTVTLMWHARIPEHYLELVNN